MEPGDAIWCAVIGAALAADVVLIRRGHESLSTRAGLTPLRRAAVAYLACHLLRQPRWLRAVDPLAIAASRIRRV